MNENFRFLAGQYVDILLKDGKRRSYSIANAPKPEGVTVARASRAPHAGRRVHRPRLQQS